MKLSLKLHDTEYTVNSPGDDHTWPELMTRFIGILQSAGYILPKELIEISLNEEWDTLKIDSESKNDHV